MTAQVSTKTSRSAFRDLAYKLFGDWDRTQLTFSFLLVGLMAILPLFVRSPY
jgi:hypothetical protein